MHAVAKANFCVHNYHINYEIMWFVDRCANYVFEGHSREHLKYFYDPHGPLPRSIVVGLSTISTTKWYGSRIGMQIVFLKEIHVHTPAAFLPYGRTLHFHAVYCKMLFTKIWVLHFDNIHMSYTCIQYNWVNKINQYKIMDDSQASQSLSVGANRSDQPAFEIGTVYQLMLLVDYIKSSLPQ